MKGILLVALGGAAGALLRWGVAGLVDRIAAPTRFPYGILAANLIGCLLIGLLFGFAENRNWLNDPIRWLALVGFLGSFTTFSTFGWNTFELIRTGHTPIAVANILVSLAGGVLAVWAGYTAAR